MADRWTLRRVHMDGSVGNWTVLQPDEIGREPVYGRAEDIEVVPAQPASPSPVEGTPGERVVQPYRYFQDGDEGARPDHLDALIDGSRDVVRLPPMQRVEVEALLADSQAVLASRQMFSARAAGLDTLRAALDATPAQEAIEETPSERVERLESELVEAEAEVERKRQEDGP